MVAEAWAELLQQNWRVELDYGLGAQAPEAEGVLVVAAPAAVQRLLMAAAAADSAEAGGAAVVLPPAGSLAVVTVAGTQAGDPTDWRQLRKRVLVAGRVPAAGREPLDMAALQLAATLGGVEV